MPNGSVRKAQLVSGTNNGYRTVQIGLSCGEKVAGRVSSRHGFSEPHRIHNLEVKARDAHKVMDWDSYVTVV